METNRTFTVNDGVAEAKVRGFTVVERYNSLACGTMTKLRVPAGTKVVETVRQGHSVGYGNDSVKRYRLPDGTEFTAGGGGPVDADTIKFE